MATVSSVTSTPTATGSTTGLNSMSTGDFLKVMIAQLQQQDPLNPSNSDQLLSQMSQISSMQASQNLNTTLQGLSLQQSIGAGANMIGKTVQGVDATGNQITGTVTSVKIANQQVHLELDTGNELPMPNVTAIAPTTGAATAVNGIPAPIAQALAAQGIDVSKISSSQLTQALSALVGGKTN